MNRITARIGAVSAAVGAAFLPLITHAQIGNAIGTLNETELGTGTSQTLPQLIGSFINVFLGLLGIVFVVIIVYAGFLYLTDQGEGKKVEQAKKLITNSVIGLVIIVAAYAIAAFVIDALSKATTGA